jgi:hypothetical protein
MRGISKFKHSSINHAYSNTYHMHSLSQLSLPFVAEPMIIADVTSLQAPAADAANPPSYDSISLMRLWDV